MKKYLRSGNKSGLGKYLYDNLPKSLGFGRKDFNLVKREDFDTIIHCAFNKENNPLNYYQYLEDNIFLTQELLNLKPKKFIYISTVDVYNPSPTMYGLFKKFAESIVEKDKNALILRCSMMLGPTMKPNHITKLKNNIEQIGLSDESTFNYILMDDILNFFNSLNAMFSLSANMGTDRYVCFGTFILFAPFIRKQSSRPCVQQSTATA